MKSQTGLSSHVNVFNSHVNVLLVISVFYNIHKVAHNAHFETTLSPALIFDYNEKLSTECVNF